MDIKENVFYKSIWESTNSKVIVRTISVFKSQIPDLAKEFINFKTFPYANTLFGELLNFDFKKITKIQKEEILGILEKYENEIDLEIEKKFCEAQESELVENLSMEEEKVKTIDRAELFKEVKGGQYCEMLLTNLAINLGYEKILPKLYLEWGYLSPTGIDVTYFDLKNKKLLLGECKIFKDIKAALRSVHKDLDKIYNDSKLDQEISEWKSKLYSMPDTVANEIIDNELYSKEAVINYVKEVEVVGFVIGNTIDSEKLKDYIDSFNDFSALEKIKVYMVTIPIESKDYFVECCHNVIRDMRKEVELSYE